MEKENTPKQNRCDTFSFLEYIHTEKLAHKEHRHKHVLQKLILSGGILGIGQLIDNQNLFFSMILFVPLICLVHDIYIFAEHFKVKRIGFFLDSYKDKYENDLVSLWETYVDDNREKFALWGSLVYTIMIAAFSAASPWILDIKMTSTHFVLYGLFMGANFLSIFFVFVVARILEPKLKRA